MYVLKRDGRQENIDLDKITRRLSILSEIEPRLDVDILEITKKVVNGVYNGVSTIELDTLSSEICAGMTSIDPDYGTLAGRLYVSSLHKETPQTFSEYVKLASNEFNEEFLTKVSQYSTELDKAIVIDRDYSISYFGLKTLDKSYLIKKDNKIVERPQYMFMRVAVAIHSTIEDILETYNLMSQKYFIHATPTLYNAGRHKQQLSSCFVTQIESDSIEGIFNTAKNCALISKSAGGIGLSVSNVRSTGSKINGGGESSGLVPMLRVFNNIAKYVDQGGNKRPGAIAVYIEPWHADIFDVLEIRKNHGSEEFRARDLFLALWVPDLFMQRVKDNSYWSLFSPSDAPGLDKVWGADFNDLYVRYEGSCKRTVVEAQKLWSAIISVQIETGTPYILYKDACNRTSNHNHLGTIKGSNLCVAPETLVLTRKGYVEIKSLKNKQVDVWNGVEFSNVIPRQTGVNSRLVKVYFSNGTFIKCTPNHKFHVNNKIKEASHLEKGDLVDEWILSENIDADLSEQIYKLSKHFGYCGEYNVEHKCLCINVKPYSSICISWILVLQTLGVPHNVIENDEFKCIMIFNPRKLVDNGFIFYFDIGSNMILDNYVCSNVVTNVRVEKVEHVGYLSETYCFTEPKRHTGIFNGVLAGQCEEIIEYFDENETAVCNLASIGLPTYVTNNKFDYRKLHDVVKVVTKNLNKIIDINYYPIESAQRSNLRHRPIGIGVQGLADVFLKLDLSFDSKEARLINKNIFETIYHGALESSCEIAKVDGTYPSYEKSRISKNILHFDSFDVHNKLYKWINLRYDISNYGIRNSLLVAPMPTASTSQILGFNECFEPYTSNIYTRRVKSGEFQMINSYLIEDLKKINLWNRAVKNTIIVNSGSVQTLNIPTELKLKYRTVWEIPQKSIIDMAIDRMPYIDQSQSLNIHIADPTYSKLTSMHFYGWSNGLKSGMYYLRTKAATKSIQYTVSTDINVKEPSADNKDKTCTVGCESCSA